MDRHIDTKSTTNTDNKRIFETTIFPTIPVSDDDLYIYSRDGDRLDLLASRYYGDSSLWWIIAQANFIGKGTLYIEPGLKLRLPTNPQQVLSQLNAVNESR